MITKETLNMLHQHLSSDAKTQETPTVLNTYDDESDDDNGNLDSNSLMDVYIGLKIHLSDDDNMTPQKLRQLIIQHKLTDKLNQNSTQLDRFNNTILHMAIANESDAMYESIIDAAHDFINPNVRDIEGKSLLILAAKMRNSTLVSKLLTTKFKENVDTNAQDKDGFTALDYAYALGDVTSINALKQHGATDDFKRSSRLSCSREALLALLSSVGINGLRDENAKGNTTTLLELNGTESLAPMTKSNIIKSLEYLTKKKILNSSEEHFLELYKHFSQMLTGISLVERCILEKAELAVSVAFHCFFKPKINTAATQTLSASATSAPADNHKTLG
jgi:ankyrin repeat protein